MSNIWSAKNTNAPVIGGKCTDWSESGDAYGASGRLFEVLIQPVGFLVNNGAEHNQNAWLRSGVMMLVLAITRISWPRQQMTKSLALSIPLFC